MKKKVTKKMGYQFGGPQMTGTPSQGPSAGQTAGSVLQGVGGMVSMIPGWGTAVGMGMSAVGSILQATSGPKMTTPVNYNTNPYGYAMGGNLNPLAANAYEVKANEPSKTDSVNMGKFALDHKEVVVGDNVFSDSLKNPVTNMSFAHDAKQVQQALGRFQKMQAKTGDGELQDAKHLNKDTQQMFSNQEKLAQMLGLRNPDGTPVQGGKNGMQWGGKKTKMQFGGPGDGLLDVSQFNSGQMFNGTEVPTTASPYFNSPNLFNQQFQDGVSAQGVVRSQNPKQYTFNPNNESPVTNGYTQPMPTNPAPGYEGFASPVGGGTPQPAGNFTSPVNNQSGSPMDNEYIKKLMKDLHPYGETANAIGQGVSAASVLVNRPKYVNYANVGQEEIRQQNMGLRRLVEGEKSALQDATDSSRSAMAELQNRSLQSRNANLRNIAAGETDAKNKVRGQFAGLEANARMQVGARRTGIEQVNLQKNMQQDQINTQEFDTMNKENMKALMNFRELGLEKQGVMNQVRRDEILKGLLQTKDFKWDTQTMEIVQKLLSGQNVSSTSATTSSTATPTQVEWWKGVGKKYGF